MGVWWVLERSTLGFRVRAVGLNSDAARYAGMRVGHLIVLTMAIAGGLAGSGRRHDGARTHGGADTRGHRHTRLRRHRGGSARAIQPLGGCCGSAILFGGLNAGAVRMQAETQIPADIVIVIQALIILFVAAPALVRAIYRIRTDRAEDPDVHLVLGRVT